MKIGIVTFQRTDNYGAVLQAYALQSFLIAQGHEVEILDYWPAQRESFLRRWLAINPRNCMLKWQFRDIERTFARFRSRHLRLSIPRMQDPKHLASQMPRYDVLVAGSDQIWNPTWISRIDGGDIFYLLGFGESSTRRIAFAASFGHDGIDTIPPEWQMIFKEHLPAFNAISVREPSGTKLVKKLCGRDDAVAVCDPTLLVPRSLYERLMPPSKSGTPYMLAFMLHGQEQASISIGRQLVHATGYPLRTVLLHTTQVLFPRNLPPSPGEWLRLISETELLITNSFHGVVFALIFHRPFIVLHVSGSAAPMNNRITGLLDRLGLAHRIVDHTASIDPGFAFAPVDWSHVDAQLAAERDQALAFLKQQLIQTNAEAPHAA